MKQEKAITLVALIITIILLLILSGVVITLVLRDNGILNKAVQTREEYTYQSVKEKLELKIADLQIEKYAQATLHDLKQLEMTDNEITQIELNNDNEPTEALVYIDGYIFVVDKNLNIIDGYKAESIITPFKPMITSIGAHSFTVEVDANSKEGTIVSYEFYINGILEKTDTKPTYTKQDCDSNSIYEIYVIVTDEKGNTRKSSIVRQMTEKEMLFTKEILQQGNIFGNVTVLQGNVNNADGLSITGTSSAPVGGVVYSKYMRWYKEFDLTEYTKLTFYAKKGTNHGGIYIFIDGSLVYSKPYPNFSTQWEKYEIDISQYTQIHEIGIGGGYADKTGNTSSNTQYGDIRLTN